MLLAIVGIFFSLMSFRLLTQKKKTALEDRVKDLEKNKIKESIVSSVISLAVALNLLYTYKPTENEVSLAILIKHLKDIQLIPVDVYERLLKHKPYRIETMKHLINSP